MQVEQVRHMPGGGDTPGIFYLGNAHIEVA